MVNSFGMDHLQISKLSDTRMDLQCLIDLLRNLNGLFIPPLSSVLNIEIYAQKLLSYAEVFVPK